MPTPELFRNQPPFPDGLPTCDLAELSYKKLLVGDPDESKRLFQACTDTGFFLLDLRDLSEGQELLHDAGGLYKVIQDFGNLDDAEKAKYRSTGKARYIFGWKAIGTAKLENGLPDRYEFYSVSQDGILDPTGPRGVTHPQPVEDSRPLIKSFIQHSHAVCDTLFAHLDKHLHLPPNTLASLHPPTKPSMTTVRLIHMPPQPTHQQISLFGHTDNGSITILFNVIGGLQILPPGLANEERNWRWFRPRAGFAVVNLGDALVQWSGGLLRSNLHRVVGPPGEQAGCERYSFAYVLKPDAEARMKRLEGEGVAAGAGAGAAEDVNDRCTYDDWLAVKARSTGEGKNLIRITAAS